MYDVLGSANNQVRFDDTKIDGMGKFVDEDGNVFDGMCSNGMKNGRGKTYYTNGDVYEGGKHTVPFRYARCDSDMHVCRLPLFGIARQRTL